MASDNFRSDIKTIILKRFISIAEAKIYEARLNEAGIRTFLSNTNTGQLLPFHDGGIVLHIQENDLEEAADIVAILDRDAVLPYEEDYREADHDDIDYARQLKETEDNLERSKPNWLIVFLILLLIAIFLLSEIM